MAPYCKFGTPNISESRRARKLKLKPQLDIVTYSPRASKIFRYGAYRGHRAPNVNLGSPKISETTRARMLKLKTQLDIVKYSLFVKVLDAHQYFR